MRPLVTCTLVLGAALVAGVAARGAAPVSDAGPRIEAVSVGFQGLFKVGHWTPVWISLQGGSASQPVALEILAPDTDGVPAQFRDEVGQQFVLAPGKATTVVRYFKPGQTSGDLTIRVRQGRGVVAERRLSAGQYGTPLAADYPLVVTYGGPLPVGEALALGGRLSGAAARTSQLERAEQLPDEWLGYEGVNVLVLPTSRPALLEALSDRQRAALQRWVRLGGRLVFCVGARGAELLDQGGPWAELSPGRFGGVVPVRSASALETYSGSAQPLETSAAGRSALRMTRLQDVRGKVELSDTAIDGLRPIIVRHVYGLGMVMFVAYDLDAPPLAGWEGTPRVLAKVLERLLKTADQGTPEQRMGRVAHEGYRDLVGQLRTALDEFPGVTLVAFSWIAGLVLLYVVLIGPGDYFLLRRLVGQMHWTWLTFPLLVLAFGGLAVWLNFTLKQGHFQVNQADIVDIDAGSGAVRGTSWFHVYSPATAAFDFALDADGGFFPQRQEGSALSWQGLPGAALGGMSSRSPVTSFQTPYAIVRRPDQRTGIEQMPIAVRSTRSLVGRWWGAIELDAKPDLEVTADGLLRGTIRNPLPAELTDCALLFENWAYRLEGVRGRLGPGEATRIDREHPFNLEWRLMRRRVKDTDLVITPWDAASKDIPRILEMMMFHGAAGAAGYTQLTHQYQGFVDLSDHLTAGCAVLVGRLAQPAVRLASPDIDLPERRDQAWTFVRVVWPVRPGSAARQPPLDST